MTKPGSTILSGAEEASPGDLASEVMAARGDIGTRKTRLQHLAGDLPGLPIVSQAMSDVSLMDETTKDRVSSPAVDLHELRAHLRSRNEILDEEISLTDKALAHAKVEVDTALETIADECRSAGSSEDQCAWIQQLVLGIAAGVSEHDITRIIHLLSKGGEDGGWRTLVQRALSEMMTLARQKHGKEQDRLLSRIASARLGLSLSIGGLPTRNPIAEPRRAAIAWGAWGLGCYGTGENAVAAIDEGMRDACNCSPTEIATLEGFSYWATRWAAAGFPAITPTHKLAAALMATSLPAEHIPDVVFPWDAFVIDVPDGLIGAQSVGALAGDVPDDSTVPMIQHDVRISTLVLMRHPTPDGGRSYSLGIVLTPGGLFGTWWFDDLSALLDPTNREAFRPVSTIHLTQRTNTTSARVLEMLGRLALGCLIEMDSDARKAELRRRTTERLSSSSTSSKEGKDDKPREPSAWIFQLARNVRVDARRWVGEYIQHGGRAPSVRFLVRGHHKRQVCGVGRTNRKWIHVEPYWKGDDALPIAVRAHILASGDKEDR